MPLIFGCVTAQGRIQMSRLAEACQLSEVLAIEADCLWLTRRGYQNLQRAISGEGCAPERIKVKAVYDRAWFSGEHIAVVERQGKRYICSPGVPLDIAVGSNGRVQWPIAMDWHVDGDPNQRRGIRRSIANMDADKICASVPSGIEILPYSDTVNDPILSDDLLRAVGDAQRTVDDDD